MSKQFLDSGGFRGKPKAISKAVSQSKKAIRFRSVGNMDYVLLEIPTEIKSPLKVTKNNAIKLAYWILDECSTL